MKRGKRGDRGEQAGSEVGREGSSSGWGGRGKDHCPLQLCFQLLGLAQSFRGLLMCQPLPPSPVGLRMDLASKQQGSVRKNNVIMAMWGWEGEGERA